MKNNTKAGGKIKAGKGGGKGAKSGKVGKDKKSTSPKVINKKSLTHSSNPLIQYQQNKFQKATNGKKKVIKKKAQGLEDVDDITLEEYKQSEINTLKRIRNHVYEGGDEFDNYNILEDNNQAFDTPNVFQFTETDIGNDEFLSAEQISQMKRKLKKTNVAKELENSDESEGEEEVTQDPNNVLKMSKKEKAKARLARQLEEAKRIHFQTLAPIKKKFWRDTQKNLTEEDHRNLRIKIKAKVDKSLDSQVVPRPIMSFDDPDLPASMKKYLAFLTNKYPDITRPTPVQSQCWPSILSGEDILSIAQTGSGKTLGYLLPCIPNIIAQLNIRKEGRLKKLEEQKKNPSILKKSNQGPVVLIIVPTRELAKQVESSCKPLKSKFNIHSIAIYGGVDAQEQKEILGQEHNEIIIATPGRLVDLIQRSKEVVGLLGGVSMLIFDEADRMLQLGFGDQLQKISEQIRPDRQTLMFSATFPHAMQEASTKWLKAPLKIRVKSSSANQESTAIVSKNVKQVAKVIQEKDRTEYLSKFITSIMDRELCLRNRSLILIFVNTIRSVKPLLTAMEKVASAYTKRKYKVGAIHGDMKQNERDDVISDFKSGKISILVATDILGRGIHIGGLRFVINYDFPTSLEQYIHRVGRTGRQGNKGHALTFFTQIVQNLPMAKGLIRILEECGQQVSTELRAIADSHQGTLDNIEFEKLAQLLKGEEDPFGSDEEDIMEQDDDSEFDSNDEDEYSNDEQEDDD